MSQPICLSLICLLDGVYVSSSLANTDSQNGREGIGVNTSETLASGMTRGSYRDDSFATSMWLTLRAASLCKLAILQICYAFLEVFTPIPETRQAILTT
jgi:hypothetical protein